MKEIERREHGCDGRDKGGTADRTLNGCCKLEMVAELVEELHKGVVERIVEIRQREPFQGNFAGHVNEEAVEDDDVDGGEGDVNVEEVVDDGEAPNRGEVRLDFRK